MPARIGRGRTALLAAALRGGDARAARLRSSASHERVGLTAASISADRLVRLHTVSTHCCHASRSVSDQS
jgi:hypothetical protein